MPSHPQRFSPRVCIHFNKPRGCFRGKGCKYLHIRDGGGKRTEDSQPNETTQSEWVSRDLEKIPPLVSTKPKVNSLSVLPQKLGSTKKLKRSRNKPASPVLCHPQNDSHCIPQLPCRSTEATNITTIGPHCQYPAGPNSIALPVRQATQESYSTKTTQFLSASRAIEAKPTSPGIPISDALQGYGYKSETRGVKRERDCSPILSTSDLDAMSLVYPPSSPSLFRETTEKRQQVSSPCPSKRECPSFPVHASGSVNPLRLATISASHRMEFESIDANEKHAEETGLEWPGATSKQASDSAVPFWDVDMKLILEHDIQQGTRFLQNSGTRYYRTPPPKFRGSKAKRKAWAYTEARILEQQFGLTVNQVLMRDDGLAIDWSSDRPVWNDTLLPDAESPQLGLSVSVFTAQARPVSAVDGEHFLTRFLQILSNDPASVQSAYAQDATFSVQVHCLCKGEKLCQGFGSLWHNIPARNLQGKSYSHPIVDISLSNLPSYLGFHTRLPRNTDSMDTQVDIIILSVDTIFLASNQMIATQSSTLSQVKVWFSHSFLLRRHPSFDGLWPLEVKSHQMTIRHNASIN